MDISKYLRIWFAINNIQQKYFSDKYRIPGTTISETLKGIKKKIPENFKNAFQNQFGFPVEDVYKHIKLEIESNAVETGKESQINKSMEGKKMNKNEKILYGLEELSQEKIDQLQEIIDKWIEEDLQKRKEKRRHTEELKSQKNQKSA